MIFNSQGDAELRPFINGQTITPGDTAITLPKGAQLLGDVTIEAVDREAIYQEGYNAGYAAGYAIGYAEGQAKPYSKELQYIESSGTQYINTGFKPNQDTRVVMDFEPIAAYSSINAFFGVRDTSSATAAKQFVLWNSGASALRSDYFGTNKALSITKLLSRKIVDKNKNITSVDGVSVTNTANSGQCSNDMVIFAANSAGAVSLYSKIRLYSFKIYDNGTLVKDFIPVLDNNGIACLFERVNKQFYHNAGSGSFSYEE